MTRRPETLDELRVGDEVAIMPSGRYHTVPEIGIVQRVTKAQVTVNGSRFMRSSGFREFGHASAFFARNLGPITGDVLEQIDKARRLAAAKSLAETIAKADLTHDQIARIRAVLEGSEIGASNVHRKFL